MLSAFPAIMLLHDLSVCTMGCEGTAGLGAGDVVTFGGVALVTLVTVVTDVGAAHV